MTKRNLILIHRGPEYERDFDEIATLVNSIDRDITVYHLPNDLKVELPVSAWQYPTLTVALTSKFYLPVRRGPVLRNRSFSKLAQQSIFRQNEIPYPPSSLFEFGMTLDPIVFGDFVILKPLNLELTSSGHGLHVMRRKRAEALSPSAFSADHPIRNGERFIVQRFIFTGQYATTHRVTTFLGSALYSLKFGAQVPSPDLSSPDDVIDAGKFSHKGDFTINQDFNEEVLSLARKVASSFEDVPLLGIDFVRDINTSKFYALEVNAGGNTWHFSSQLWAERRARNPGLVLEMKNQFGAFDLAAHALVEKVRLLAD